MKIILFTVFLTIFLSATPSLVNAWGAEGHKTIGQIAQNLLKPKIAAIVANLFQDKTFGGKLSYASLWADKVKREPGSPFARWSEPLHYVNPPDNPSEYCAIKKSDCLKDACVIGAIANYTKQLDCTNGYDIYTRDFALRFLAHFIGDITQPLHVTGRAKGGNQIEVFFDRHRRDLHGIWDTDMVVKRLQDFDSDHVSYAKFLTNQIRNGVYAHEKDTWVSCDVLSTDTSQCPFTWAVDSNRINCQFVWDTIDNDPNEDLGSTYYNDAVPYIDRQLAKGGYRLGVLLNSILDKSC